MIWEYDKYIYNAHNDALILVAGFPKFPYLFPWFPEQTNWCRGTTNKEFLADQQTHGHCKRFVCTRTTSY